MSDISPEGRAAAAATLELLNAHPLRGCVVEPLVVAILDALAAGEFNKARVLAASVVDTGDDDTLSDESEQPALFVTDPGTGALIVNPAAVAEA